MIVDNLKIKLINNTFMEFLIGLHFVIIIPKIVALRIKKFIIFMIKFKIKI